MKDRFDGRYIQDIDAMHYIMPFLYPDRCDNQALFSFKIDLTALNEYLKNKSERDPEYRYNLFQCIICAVLKTITLRTKLSRFIHNRRMYQRNEVTAAFVVKQEFADGGGEVLAFIHAKPEWTIDDVHDEIREQLKKLRQKGYSDESTSFMDRFSRIPEWISRPAVELICWLEKKGKIPRALVETDPYHASVVLANLGSIGLPNGYHHLTNWGTTSLFILIGKAERMPFFENGEMTFRDGVELGITVDERIADGFYFARSMRMLKLFLEQPQLLERPLNEKLSDELWEQIR
jgi:hypothetical protein